MRCSRACFTILGLAAFVVPGCGSAGSVATPDATTSPSTSAPTETTAPATAPATTAPVDVQAVLDTWRTSFGAPAGLVALDDGGVLRTFTSGTGDPSEAPLSASTTFRVGSVTKTLVAALVLDAVSRGEVALDDDVAVLLPGLLRPGPTVTVRDLLDHSSGIFNVGDEGDVLADIDRLADPAQRSEARDLVARYLRGEHVAISDRLYVALAETHDRYFVPGQGHHYSNVNYQLAAMVLEHVTGATLPELFATRLARPLGLTDTAVAVDESLLPALHGYVRNAGGDTSDDTRNIISLGNGGSGGVVSTTTELMTAMKAIVTGRYLSAALTTDMRRPTVESNNSYGLGLATYTLQCGTFLGHGGSIAGTNSIALVAADGSRALVAIVNIDTVPDPNMTAFAEALLCR